MKRIILFLMLAISSVANAQNTLTVSGTVGDPTNPQSFEIVYISVKGLDSLGPILYFDSVLTNSNGFYTYSKTLPVNSTQGAVSINVNDCNGVATSQTFFYFPGNFNIVADIYCPVIVPCNSSFLYKVEPPSLLGYIVNFSAFSSSPNANFVWDFGDGTVGTGDFTSHIYFTSGVYTVCLTTNDTINQCSSTICDSIFVYNTNPGCLISYSAILDSTLQTASFTINGAISPSASIFWDFGDGNTSTSIAPQHTYANPGLYTVCLNIMDSANFCYSTYCGLINAGIVIIDPCSAEFSMTIKSDTLNPAGSLVSFNQLGFNFWNTVTWDFGDGTTGVGPSVFHAYASPGVYTICAYLLDTAMNCRDTVCKTVLINGPTMKVLGLFNDIYRTNLVLYPNPSNSKITIELPNFEFENMDLKVIDVLGRIVYTKQIQKQSKLELDLSDYENGVYYVELRTGNYKATEKFIKY